MLSRRQFAALALARAGSASLRSIPVALQLFSVRKRCATDLAGTLSRIAEFGFCGIEMAGYYGHPPQEIRGLLSDNGLTCCGAHVPVGSLLGDALPKTVDFHEALGNKTLVVPGLPVSMTANRDAWLQTAQLFAQISERLRARKMWLGYHNHSAEFHRFPDGRPWDLLFGNTPREVFIELDLGGCGYGGADPIAALKEFPGRTRMVHVKDYTATKPDLMIGDGDMDWRSFFPVCSKIAGTEWFVIEHDSNPATNMADIADSLRRFDALKPA